MSTIKVSRPYLWPQIIVVRREQKRARPVTRSIIGVFGEHILSVALKALSQSSAKRQAQGVSAKDRRRYELLNDREARIRAKTGPDWYCIAAGANAGDFCAMHACIVQ